MRLEIEQRLTETAKKYSKDELQRFIDEIGWEYWMDEYTEAGDYEEATERELNEINIILTKIFENSH